MTHITHSLELARAAVSCSSCFIGDPLSRAGIGVAQPFSIGTNYRPGGVAVISINPGAAKDGGCKEARKQALDRFAAGDDSALADYWATLGTDAERFWNPKYLARLRRPELAVDGIAVGNIALCATANNTYPKSMLRTCWKRHSSLMIEALSPRVVILMGGASLMREFERKPVATEVRQTVIRMAHFAHREGNAYEGVECAGWQATVTDAVSYHAPQRIGFNKALQLSLDVGRIRTVVSSTQLRDRAFRLARRNANAGLQVARGVPEPWFRAQALAAVARWIDDHRVEAVAREALTAAAACDDDYKRAAVAAWPIRALAERGRRKLALDSLQEARRRALAASPPASQAEALLQLLHGGWGLGAATRRQLVEDLETIHRSDAFWRIGRALVDALAMLSKADGKLAGEIAMRIADDRCRAKALAALQAEGACGPRDYF